MFPSLLLLSFSWRNNKNPDVFGVCLAHSVGHCGEIFPFSRAYLLWSMHSSYCWDSKFNYIAYILKTSQNLNRYFLQWYETRSIRYDSIYSCILLNSELKYIPQTVYILLQASLNWTAPEGPGLPIVRKNMALRMNCKMHNLLLRVFYTKLCLLSW